MVDKIEDLNLPTASIARLIKESLPEGVTIGKEARCAIARASSVFVIYLTSSSTALARKQNHKTITAKNIFDSLEELEFESFVPELEQELEAYRKMMKDKKDSKASKKDEINGGANAAASDGGGGEIVQNSGEGAQTEIEQEETKATQEKASSAGKA